MLPSILVPVLPAGHNTDQDVYFDAVNSDPWVIVSSHLRAIAVQLCAANLNKVVFNHHLPAESLVGTIIST
jgi:hypothetical protein